MKKLSLLILTLFMSSVVVAFSQSATVTLIQGPSDIIDCKDAPDNMLSVIANTTSGNTQFQWQRDGVDLVGGVDFPGSTTESGLFLGDLKYYMSGLYTCVVTSDDPNGTNVITTEPVAVHVLQTPKLTRSPMGSVTPMGATAMLDFEANIRGSMPGYVVEIQWYRDDVAIMDGPKYSGTNASVLLINNIEEADYDAEFHCSVVGQCGQVFSPKTSPMRMPGVSITDQPMASASEVCEGENITVTIGAEAVNGGTMDEVYYQWYKDDMLITDNQNYGGTQSATLTSMISGGDNKFYCHVYYGRDGEQMKSDEVMVYGTMMPNFTEDIADVDAMAGDDIMVELTGLTGDGTITVEWFKQGETDAMGTGNTFTIASSTMSDSGIYYAEATNSCGMDMSNTFTITVEENSPNGIVAAEKYSLMNVPNPVNGFTTISFKITNPENSSLLVTDAQGNRVAEFRNLNAGLNTIQFNSSAYNLSNGVYFYTLTTGNDRATAKMVIAD